MSKLDNHGIHVTRDDPGRIGWETAISGAWPLPKYETGPDHMLDTDYCWCQPRVEDVPPDGRIIIHRHTMDGPE